MTKSNDFGVGLMHEFVITGSKAGWSSEDVANLSKDENLMKLFHAVLKGTHEIKSIGYLIDCDENPFIPDGWKVEEHQKGGKIKLDISKMELYLSEKQKNGSIKGNELREELKGKKPMNTNVLDFLLKNPHLIPEEWKGKHIFFWGTIYRYSGGRLFVRYLRWDGDGWVWGFDWLVNDFDSGHPSAVSAS